MPKYRVTYKFRILPRPIFSRIATDMCNPPTMIIQKEVTSEDAEFATDQALYLMSKCVSAQGEIKDTVFVSIEVL